MQRCTWAIFVLAVGVTLTFGQARFENSNAITPERLKAHLEFIASDEMEGRGTPSRGLETACLYVATQLKLWGAKPAGDNGTFFQKFRLVRTVLDSGASSLYLGTKRLQAGEGFTDGANNGSAYGNAVFVGHGYRLGRKGIDPYANVTVKGKIMVVTDGYPLGMNSGDLNSDPGSSDLTPKQAAERFGAAGILMIRRTDFWATARSQNLPTHFYSPESAKPAPKIGVPLMVAGPRLIEELFAGERVSAEQVTKALTANVSSFELSPEKRLSFNVVEKEEFATINNVVAICPGKDAKLKAEFVGLGAHIDHEGTNPARIGDQIYNGADDDGSGSAALLEIAHAYLTGARPKRSMLFIWHTAEEPGLWGSQHFVDHPAIDLKKLITYINMDMIGRSKPFGSKDPVHMNLTEPDEVYARGLTKMSSKLQQTVEDVNKRFLKLRLNYDEEEWIGSGRVAGGSDHQSYFKKGILTFDFHTGHHVQYHQVDDEVGAIDFEKMCKIAKTAYASSFAIANLASRPTIDRPQTKLIITPNLIKLSAGAKQTFSARFEPSEGHTVVWKLKDPTAGTISPDGVFVASAKVGRYMVRAESASNPRIYGCATVQIAPEPVKATAPPLTIPLNPRLMNGDLELGALGAAPQDWHLVPASKDDGFVAEVSSDGPKQGAQCLAVYLKGGPGKLFANVRQAVDAKPFRGKTVRFRAAVRVEPGQTPSRAQLWIRVEGTDRQIRVYENMAATPITSKDWAYYEISVAVAEDAEVLQVGMLAFGDGKAWLDDATLGLDETPALSVANSARQPADARLQMAPAKQIAAS
ncbi:MAG: M28 family peptidase [Armatimonadetes bacterium]|nr:M28 family peptidase [Armatimonadota bacterium]